MFEEISVSKFDKFFFVKNLQYQKKLIVHLETSSESQKLVGRAALWIALA